MIKIKIFIFNLTQTFEVVAENKEDAQKKWVENHNIYLINSKGKWSEL